jgi:hypothetical protein
MIILTFHDINSTTQFFATPIFLFLKQIYSLALKLATIIGGNFNSMALNDSGLTEAFIYSVFFCYVAFSSFSYS